MNNRETSLMCRFLAAVTLAVGFGTVWFVLLLWIGISTLEAWPGQNPRRWEALVVTTDGTPLVQSRTFDNLSLVTYRDRNGRENDAVDQSDQVPAMSLRGEPGNASPFFSRPGWPRRIKVFMDEREPASVWYFVHDGSLQGSGYFVGYERVSNRLIGFIGLSGFRARPIPPDERVPVRGELVLDYAFWSSAPLSIHSGSFGVLRPDRWDVPPRLVHVPSGNRLRLVDLAARTISTVFEAPAPIASVGVPLLSAQSGSKPTKERPILVRAGGTIFKLDHQYQVIRTFTIPAEIDRQGSLTWYEADGGQAVLEYVRPPKSSEDFGGDTRSKVYLIAGDGAIRDSFELALQNRSNSRTERATFHLLALSLPAPSALIAVEASMVTLNPSPDYVTAFGTVLKRSWPSLAAALAISSVLAAATWRQGRRFGLPRRERAVWSVFVLLFGVPAFAGFRLQRRWPAREPCPHCHARSPRDRDACADCGTPFPVPALRGTEIFA